MKRESVVFPLGEMPTDKQISDALRALEKAGVLEVLEWPSDENGRRVRVHVFTEAEKAKRAQ